MIAHVIVWVNLQLMVMKVTFLQKKLLRTYRIARYQEEKLENIKLSMEGAGGNMEKLKIDRFKRASTVVSLYKSIYRLTTRMPADELIAVNGIIN
ncbi:hypothetical protein NVP1149O_48 [Vibrio phage 1.149.O._10N.286.55.A12]|nr:hypothetical protein NVP1149O_48 [Vibrio phage 1.149.O._10N.286.55.A12]